MIIALGGLSLSACVNSTGGEQSAVAIGASALKELVGRQTCVRCHETENRFWTGSHHDPAMQEATRAAVLGDFNDTTFTYAGVTSTFSRRDDEFFVRTDDGDGELQDYEIAYEANAAGVTANQVIDELVKQVAVA